MDEGVIRPSLKGQTGTESTLERIRIATAGDNIVILGKIAAYFRYNESIRTCIFAYVIRIRLVILL